MAEEKESAEKEVAEAAPVKSKKKLFIVIGGVVLLLIAIGVPTVMMLSKGASKNANEELDAEAAGKVKVLAPEGHDEADELVEGEEPLGAIFPLDTFVVNLNGGKFIRLQAQLEFTSRDVPSRFFGRTVVIRDAIITLLSSRTHESLVEVKDREDLKREIKDLVNEILKKEDIKKVYFTQLIVQ